MPIATRSVIAVWRPQSGSIRRLATSLAVMAFVVVGTTSSARGDDTSASFLTTVCNLIALHADENRLPRDFLARLLWKESRFNANAVSPKGAEGIAQFMPGTAALRALADPFDIRQAIPASASYLADLEKRFGNLGLAAAAYNSGEGRVSRWIRDGGFLPLETENYVLGILGEPADSFLERSHRGSAAPLDPSLPFGPACRRLPVAASAAVAMASRPDQPWGIQVAGGAQRDAAVRQWQRLQQNFPSLLGQQEPVISRVRTAHRPGGMHAVRIGAQTRSEADSLCERLRAAGGSCVVTRNR
jgi:hypothetical protein